MKVYRLFVCSSKKFEKCINIRNWELTRTRFRILGSRSCWWVIPVGDVASTYSTIFTPSPEASLLLGERIFPASPLPGKDPERRAGTMLIGCDTACSAKEEKSGIRKDNSSPVWLSAFRKTQFIYYLMQ